MFILFSIKKSMKTAKILFNLIDSLCLPGFWESRIFDIGNLEKNSNSSCREVE